MTTDNKHKFITIDDHPLIRDGIKDFIEADQLFECIGRFDDAREVLNSNFAGKPDVVILDLNLRNADGSRYCPLFKQRFPACKVVAFTHYEDREKELMGLGFDGYVLKYEKELLIEALITVLNGEKYFRSNLKNSTPDVSQIGKMDVFLKLKQLTPREIEVSKYISQDFSNREIGEKMFIAESTVETHRKHIKEKLQAKNKRELNTLLKTLIPGNASYQ